MSLADKISNSELEIMRILWKQGKPVSSAEIRQQLFLTKGWEKSTVLTLIRRLLDKQVITSEKQEILYYSSLVTEQEYADAQTEEIVSKLYQGSAKNMVAALYQGGKLTNRDIMELKELFHMEDEDE